ncbi:N-acetyltransferase [Streptomyces anulatus]|uniref:N-acetyltransferase n=1 Tax=Streptomyces anulatus TaxID=1892 RepID=UPI0036DF1AFC
MELKITTLAERPELAGALDRMPDTWPEFILEDLVGWANFPRIAVEFPQYVLVATDPEGAVVARAFSVPFVLDAPGRGELPVGGWDQVLLWAFSDLRRGRTPDTVSAIDITVATGHLGQGISGRMLAAMRDNARRLGFGQVVAPVRPNGKHLRSGQPMEEYARLTRPEDGLPEDPWLRVHARAGGKVDSVATVSMTVRGSHAQWREWTGLPFDTDGPVEVPGALVPVHCALAHGYAVYVEPNVWVRHQL